MFITRVVKRVEPLLKPHNVSIYFIESYKSQLRAQLINLQAPLYYSFNSGEKVTTYKIKQKKHLNFNFKIILKLVLIMYNTLV